MKKYRLNIFEEGTGIQLYDYLESNRKHGWCVIAISKFLITFQKKNTENIIIGVEREKEKDWDEAEVEYNGLSKNEYRNNQLQKSGWNYIGRNAEMRVYIGDEEKQLLELEPMSEYKKSISDKYHTKLKSSMLIGSLLFIAVLILCFYFDLLHFNFDQYNNIRDLYFACLILFLLFLLPYEALRTWLVHRKLLEYEKDIVDLPVLSYSTYLYVRWCQVIFLLISCSSSYWTERFPWIGMIAFVLIITSLIPDAIHTLSLLRNPFSSDKIS